MIPRTLAWLLLLIGAALAAVDLSKRLDPQGPLGLGLEYEFAKTGSSRRRPWQYNTHITFNEPTSAITDGQLVQIAVDAMDEMYDEQLQYGVKKTAWNTPYVISAIRFDNEIIVASSQKGGWQFMQNFPESKVSDALRRCQATFRQDTGIDTEHKNGASCGEVMAAHIFYQLYPDKNLQDMDVVSVSVAEYILVKNGITGVLKKQVIDPCPKDAQVSCPILWECLSIILIGEHRPYGDAINWLSI